MRTPFRATPPTIARVRDRLRRPLTWVWAGSITLALLLGLVIGGSPLVPKDVPLKDRKVTATTSPAPGGGNLPPATTTTKPGG